MLEIHQVRDSKRLVKFIEENQPEYIKSGNWFQGSQMSNGAYMTSLFNFLDDNPGAIEKLVKFMEENNMINKSEDSEEED